MERAMKKMRARYAEPAFAKRPGKFVPGRARRSAPRAPAVYVNSSAGLNRRAVASKETGFVDLAAAAYQCDSTGSVTLIATIAQGASVNQRVGKKVLLKSLQMRGTLGSNTTTTIADTAWLVVYDKRPQGALPTVSDILVSASSNAFNNDANSGRFSIVRRSDQVCIGNATTPATGKEAYDVSEYIKLNGRQTVYKAAGTGAIGDIEEGALYFVTIGTSVGTAAANINVGFRTRFIDI